MWKPILKPAIAVALLLSAGSIVEAGYPWSIFDRCCGPLRISCRDCGRQQCGCCDDYCSKPLPCIAPACPGCADDYCGKPLPCVPRSRPGCVEDYCGKPCPPMPRPLCLPWYRCGTPERCYGGLQVTPGCGASSLR